MTMSLAQAKAIFMLAQDVRTLRSLSLSSAVVLVYDAIISFPDELEYIWTAKWSLGKLLYLFSRYATMSGFILWVMFNMGFGLSLDNFCISMDYFTIWGVYIFSIPAQVILTLRTIAIWERDRKVFSILVVMAGIHNISSMVCIILLTISSLSNDKANTLLGPLLGCYAESSKSSPTSTAIAYGMLILFDTTLFCLILTKAIQVGRSDKFKIFNILVRDGVIYFAVLLVFSVANLIFGGAFFGTHIILSFPLILAELSAKSIGSCHVILNLRKYSYKLEQFRSLNLSEFDGIQYAQRRTIMDEFSIQVRMEDIRV